MSNITSIDHEDGVFDMLRAIDRGDFVLELEEAVSEVVNAAVENNKVGEVNIKLKFEFDPQTHTIRIAPKVTKKVPMPVRRAALFFLTDKGKLSRKNPHQREMFEEVL